MMIRIPIAAFMALAGLLKWAHAENNFPAMYSDAAVFERALEKIPAFPEALEHEVTGIVVPHHLAAADLMALGFRAANRPDVERIILLTPDHFKISTTPIATTRRGFDTVWGEVPVDEIAVDALLAGKSRITESELFAKEHGVHALLPFIARLYPKASIVPVAIRIDSKNEDWLPLIDDLFPLCNDSTLIVQSTDFSHYLNHHKARLHDQQTMNTFATRDPALAAALKQPDHIDSRASQFVHMALQQRLGNQGHSVIGNKNSQDGSIIHQPSTTSYVVQVFEKEQAQGWPARDGEELWYFAGDSFFGRNVFPVLSKADRFDEVLGKITRITRGAPMVVNLEGIMVPRVIAPRAQRPLAMQQDFALKCLKALNVRAASLANNHSHDLGAAGLKHTADFLKNNGIVPIVHGETVDLGWFRIIGLTDLNNELFPRLNRLNQKEISDLIGVLEKDKPAIVFVHWGEEWQAEMTPRQETILDWLTAPLAAESIVQEGLRMTIQARPNRITHVIGAHPHVASSGLALRSERKVLIAPTTGNLIFDQPQGNGSLIEIRFFPCGTHATRLIPLGNVLSR